MVDLKSNANCNTSLANYTCSNWEGNARREQAEGSPVTVAPELLVEIGAVAVVVSKRSFALDPVDDETLHSFLETAGIETSEID